MLSQKLKEVLNCNYNNLLVGINIKNSTYIEKYTNFSKNYYLRWIEKNKLKIGTLLNKGKYYYSSMITRFYIEFKDKRHVPQYIKILKKIWNNKDILIIEGENTRIGVGNDLINNAKSIKRIICPTINAFDVYDKIINEIVIKIKKQILILISLGPTATILAYDLSKMGYQAVDVGHIDIEYEWFLKNVTKKVKIRNKYVNEAVGGCKNITKIKDILYNQQIIKKIIN
jgi:glycosyltransferase family protein